VSSEILACAISSLQHPYICVLHDVGQDEGAGEFLLMELLEVETVAERLKRGRLPLSEAPENRHEDRQRA
jgi:eukaryotic-like serine/threonine-protein kinase